MQFYGQWQANTHFAPLLGTGSLTQPAAPAGASCSAGRAVFLGQVTVTKGRRQGRAVPEILAPPPALTPHRQREHPVWFLWFSDYQGAANDNTDGNNRLYTAPMGSFTAAFWEGQKIFHMLTC